VLVAFHWLKAAIQMGDDIPLTVYLSLAIVAEKQHKLDEALSYLEKYMKSNPRDYNAW
jgi:hypothetical protein